MPIGGGSSVITIGTTAFSGGTTGSVLFVGASSVVQQDNANFFWDDTNNRLGLRNTGAVATGQTALAAGDLLVLGLSGSSSSSNKTTIIFNNQGLGSPSGIGATSNGDKVVLYSDATSKTALGVDAGGNSYYQSFAEHNHYFENFGAAQLGWKIARGGLMTLYSTTLLATGVSLTNGAGASTGTLTNAPAVGNPTKWIPINDNGTTRYIPAW